MALTDTQKKDLGTKAAAIKPDDKNKNLSQAMQSNEWDKGLTTEEQRYVAEKPQQATTQKTKAKTSQQQQNNIAALIESDKAASKTRNKTSLS